MIVLWYSSCCVCLQVVGVMTEGDYFGELCAMNLCPSRICDVTTADASELLSLSRYTAITPTRTRGA